MDRHKSAWTPLSDSGKETGATSPHSASNDGSNPGGVPSLDLLPTPLLMVDADGVVLYQNPASTDLIRALQVENVSALWPDDFEDAVRRCLHQGRSVKVISSPGNGRRHFMWTLMPDAAQAGVQVYGSETTDRHRLKERLYQAEQLEMVGKLAGFVAHDLANNLTVIQGHLGMVQSGQVEGAQVEDSVRHSLRAAERAADLVRQLFALRGIESPQMAEVQLTQVLGAFSGRLQRLLGEDISVVFQFDPELPMAWTDEGRVQQLLTAAALTVRSAIPSGGTLTIMLSVPGDDSACDEMPGGEHLCVSLLGMGAMESARSTLESTLVQSLVDQLNGAMRLAEAPEFGLRLYLPASTPIEDEALDSTTDPGMGQETILLVEDEAPVRSILRMALERRGYHVVEAATGVEALAVWHQHHDQIALLVTDMVMPVGLSGCELAEKFRIQNPQLKVLYVSGYTAEAAGLPVSLSAGEGYLRKPLDPDELTRAVRDMIDG